MDKIRRGVADTHSTWRDTADSGDGACVDKGGTHRQGPPMDMIRTLNQALSAALGVKVNLIVDQSTAPES